jgi:hypothetical protein
MSAHSAPASPWPGWRAPGCAELRRRLVLYSRMAWGLLVELFLDGQGKLHRRRPKRHFNGNIYSVECDFWSVPYPRVSAVSGPAAVLLHARWFLAAAHGTLAAASRTRFARTRTSCPAAVFFPPSSAITASMGFSLLESTRVRQNLGSHGKRRSGQHAPSPPLRR